MSETSTFDSFKKLFNAIPRDEDGRPTADLFCDVGKDTVPNRKWDKTEKSLLALMAFYCGEYGRVFIEEKVDAYLATLDAKETNADDGYQYAVILNRVLIAYHNEIEREYNALDLFLRKTQEVNYSSVCRAFIPFRVIRITKYIESNRVTKQNRNWISLIIAFYVSQKSKSYEKDEELRLRLTERIAQALIDAGYPHKVVPNRTAELFGLVNNHLRMAGYGGVEFERVRIPETPDNLQIRKPLAPLDGQFSLSWKYVKFENGFMWLYHPLYPYGDPSRPPLKYEDERLRREYNDLSSLFAKKLSPIEVISKDGKIKTIVSPIDVSSCVENLITYVAHAPIEKKPQEIKKIAALTPKEAKDMIGEHGSEYLNALNDMQLEDYKVYHCQERRVNSNREQVVENGFIYVIGHHGTTLNVVYESLEDGRASIVFSVDDSRLHEAVDAIHAFFVSDVINKRSMIASKGIEFTEPYIRSYNRLVHSGLVDWEYSILRYSGTK